MWFHTLAGTRQSMFILRTQGGEPTDEMLTLAARYAAYFSRARESSKVAVDYTPVKFIKKPPASPLGFVIYTNQKTAVNRPERTGIKQRNKFLRISKKALRKSPIPSIARMLPESFFISSLQ